MIAKESNNNQQHMTVKHYVSNSIKVLALLMIILLCPFRGQAAMNLKDAFSLLKEQNPTIQEAIHRISGAQAQIQAARSAYLPKWTLRSSYLGSDNPIQVFGAILNQSAFTPGLDFNNVPTVDNLNLQSMLTYPLFTGGQRKAQLMAATSQRKAAEWASQVVERHLQLTITEVMLDITKARSMIQTANQAVQSMESNLTLSQNRRDAGTALEQEVLDVQVKLSDARIARLQAQNMLNLAKASLRMLLAWPEDQTLDVADEMEQIVAPDESKSKQRPERLAARALTNSAQEQLRAAKAESRPKVQLFGSYDANHGWKTGESLGSWTAGIAMEWSLWSGGLNKAKRDKAQSGLRASESREEALRLQHQFEIQKAKLELTEARLRSEMAAETVQLAEESLRLTRNRYEQGLGIVNQLLDAETAQTKARMDATHAHIETTQATARLRHALGLPILDTTPNISSQNE